MVLRTQAAARAALADAFLARYGGRSERLDPPGMALVAIQREAAELARARLKAAGRKIIADAPAGSVRGIYDARHAVVPPVPGQIEPAQAAEIAATLSESFALLRRMSALRPDERAQVMIIAAHVARGIPFADPAWLTYSPFGWHGSILQAMACDPRLPFGDERIPLDIACYGAGWCDTADILHASRMHRGMPAEEAAASIADYRAMQVTAWGPHAGTSYEARDLLATFLSGERPGALTVFDNDPRVADDLRSPNYTHLDYEGVMGRRSEIPEQLAVAAYTNDYWRLVSAGREVRSRVAGILQDADSGEGDEVSLLGFRFDDSEWAKLRVVPYDMITAVIPASPQGFDLSVWLEGAYFFPGASFFFHLADIVHRTRVGGHVLTSFMASPTAQGMLGLRHRRRVGGDRLWRTAAHLYQRVAGTQQTLDLVAQKEGISIAPPRR